MLPMRTDGQTTSKDRATQLLICEPLSFAILLLTGKIICKSVPRWQNLCPGGIIESWSPIYWAENPLQVAFILLKYLTKSELQEFCVSYDNFCNLSRLKLFKSSLLLEPPMDKLWCSINNVIDDLNKGQQQGKIMKRIKTFKLIKSIYSQKISPRFFENIID